MKLLITLGTAALLTAACTASASSGSGASTVKTANTLHLTSGSNASADAPGDLDVNRVNPLAGKPGIRPLPPAQPHAVVVPAPLPPFGIAQDRCGGGIGNPPAAGNRGAPVLAGKRPQLPACMPE